VLAGVGMTLAWFSMSSRQAPGRGGASFGAAESPEAALKQKRASRSPLRASDADRRAARLSMPGIEITAKWLGNAVGVLLIALTVGSSAGLLPAPVGPP